ncbi:MAG: hypothetical protein ACOY40_18395 [Bacillota bacterium]
MYDYFLWAAGLAKTSKVMSGLMVVATMAGLGIGLAVIADVVIKLTGINVGSYKKEYEDQLPGH